MSHGACSFEELGQCSDQDICQGLASGSGIKGMSPHYSHDTHATNDD